MQRFANDNVSSIFTYDNYSRFNRVNVSIDSLTHARSFGYDVCLRLTALNYRGGEAMTTEYGSRCATVGSGGSFHPEVAGEFSWDYTGRGPQELWTQGLSR